MHFIDGVAVGSINHAELEALQGESEAEPEQPAPAPVKAKRGATVTSEDTV